MKKLISLLLVLCLCMSVAFPVFATEDVEETEEIDEVRTDNVCGEDLTWEFSDGTLTITGTGAMDDFSGEAPWAQHKKEIKRVVLSGEVTYIGARAFSNYDALATVNFGNALYEIGKEAFKSCDGLTVIYLPASFKIFGESSFASCSGLSAIHCSGKFPSFKLNCMWDTYGKIYYPAEKPWGVEYIEQMETAFKGRIEFLASDGTDHYNPEEPTEPATEEPTEEPTAAPMPAPTQPPTERPTEAPVTVPEVIETMPETEPETDQETLPMPETDTQPESKSWIGLVIIGAVLAFVLLGMIAIKLGGRKGKYSKGRKRRR